MIRPHAAFAASFVLATCVALGSADAADASFLTPGGNAGTIAGTVDWSNGRDAGGATTFVGHATFPDAGVVLDLSVRRNTDKSLPASHVIDVTLQPAANFGGKPVDEIGPLSVRASATSKQSSPLVAVGTHVKGNAFLLALSGAPDDVSKNLKLLANAGSLDVGLAYTKGAKADVLLDLDQAGQDAMARFLKSGN